MESKKHIDTKKEKTRNKKSIEQRKYIQAKIKGERQQSRNVKKRNRCIMEKFYKATYFLARKKWVIRENFSDVDFLRDLGDQVSISENVVTVLPINQKPQSANF